MHSLLSKKCWIYSLKMCLNYIIHINIFKFILILQCIGCKTSRKALGYQMNIIGNTVSRTAIKWNVILSGIFDFTMLLKFILSNFFIYTMVIKFNTLIIKFLKQYWKEFILNNIQNNMVKRYKIMFSLYIFKA